MVIATVIKHLYLSHKLHSDAMMLKLLAFDVDLHLQERASGVKGPDLCLLLTVPVTDSPSK